MEKNKAEQSGEKYRRGVERKDQCRNIISEQEVII